MQEKRKSLENRHDGFRFGHLEWEMPVNLSGSNWIHVEVQTGMSEHVSVETS